MEHSQRECGGKEREWIKAAGVVYSRFKLLEHVQLRGRGDEEVALYFRDVWDGSEGGSQWHAGEGW